MLTRTIAGLVGLGVVLPALIWGGNLAVEVLVGVVLGIGLWEFSAMAFQDRPALWGFWRMALPGYGFYGAMLYGPPGLVAPVMALGALFLMLSVLFRAGPVDDAGRAAGLLVLGVTWIPGFLVALPLLRRMDHGLAWIFFMLAVTWLGDTGAYFAGRTFGKHKLYEKISPKKTWEGAIGGAVTAVIGALIVRAIGLPESDLLLCIVLALVLDAAGIVGDLTESMIKRTFGVKDSGRIMPGHGGILDRVDSLLFTSPVLFYALQLMGH
jgi:phosphatidate cytidylyltransferase